MPNHVANRILLHGQKLSDCSKHLFDKNGALSFGVLLPLPINHWPGGVSTIHEQHFPGTWLDSARAMWGTKWDAYGGPAAQDTSDGAVLRFKTAWGPPRGWVCALFNTLECDITADWLSEGDMTAWRECYQIKGGGWPGPDWNKTPFGPDAPDYAALHRALWGDLPISDLYGEAEEPVPSPL